MATFLDLGLFSLFEVIWPFLFVTVVSFAFFTKAKFPTENAAIHALLALLFGFVILYSRIALKTVNLMAPWFVIVFIFATFVILTYMSFGITGDQIKNIIWDSPDYAPTFGFWVLAIVLIIGIGSLSTVISEEKGFKKLGEKGEVAVQEPSEESAGFFAILTNPKVLGFALLMLIGMFTISKLVQKPNP